MLISRSLGQVLENCNLVGCSTSGSSGSNAPPTSSSRGSKGTPQHSSTPPAPKTQLTFHQPFLSLILTCLREQDDQRECLLSSLHSQLSQFLTLNKDVSTYIYILLYNSIIHWTLKLNAFLDWNLAWRTALYTVITIPCEDKFVARF